MSLLNEYISKRMGGKELEAELQRLISQYNKLRGTYLFVYAAAIGKPIPSVAIEQADFYVIHDILSNKKSQNKVDIYLETPGGSGETAEEIVEFLHNNFDTVTFVVSGEAKSAGTIIVLSGDEILMTETGSLGPIDAQVKIGRSDSYLIKFHLVLNELSHNFSFNSIRRPYSEYSDASDFWI